MGTSPDTSKARRDPGRQRRLLVRRPTQGLMQACTRGRAGPRERPSIVSKTSFRRFPHGPLRSINFASQPVREREPHFKMSGWSMASLYSTTRKNHASPFVEQTPLGFTPDCLANLMVADMRSQKTVLPTYRMPPVLDFMNADQEFPEIASP